MSRDDKIEKNELRGSGGYEDTRNGPLNEYCKEAFRESVATIKEFIKLMIPLTTGLITAYVGLLKFLVGDTISGIENVSHDAVVCPAYFMLASLVVFIAGVFPIMKSLKLGDVENMMSFRDTMMVSRYAIAILGSTLFLIGIFKMIDVLVLIIS